MRVDRPDPPWPVMWSMRSCVCVNATREVCHIHMDADQTSGSEGPEDPSEADVRTDDGATTAVKIAAAVIVLGVLGLAVLIALVPSSVSETASDAGDHGASQYRMCIDQFLNLWRH